MIIYLLFWSDIILMLSLTPMLCIFFLLLIYECYDTYKMYRNLSPNR